MVLKIKKCYYKFYNLSLNRDFHNMKKYILAALGTIILSGCGTQPITAIQTEKTYTGDGFTFKHPSSYTVSSTPLGLSVTGPQGSVLISTMALDIAPAGAVGTPKNITNHGYNAKISSGLNYEGKIAPAELISIQNSIKTTE